MSLPNERIYYAQNREDLILESFFLDVNKGFYVDVGACHPDVASVTKRFYEKGWSGINIEPQSNLLDLFRRDRPRDINLNAGVSDKNTSITMRSYINNQGLSTMSQAVMTEHEGVARNKTSQYEDIEVQVLTLESIFNTNRVKKIHFLKVDVEGFEYQVLAGNDWTKYRPEVICIEANHIVRNWRRLLTSNAYEIAFNDGLNDYYVDGKLRTKRVPKYVEYVVTKLRGGISSQDYYNPPIKNDALTLNQSSMFARSVVKIRNAFRNM